VCMHFRYSFVVHISGNEKIKILKFLICLQLCQKSIFVVKSVYQNFKIHQCIDLIECEINWLHHCY
jgi:hypothetical protein